MKLIALKDAYKDQALTKGLANVKTFVFDDPSAVNNPDQAARIFIFKPPDSVQRNEEARLEDYKLYSIEYFLFDVVGDSVDEAMADLWESIEEDVIAINLGIVNDNDDIIEITSDITMELGHHEHNANLIGIRVLYDLRVFDCVNP